jgi:hypothetical protein
MAPFLVSRLIRIPKLIMYEPAQVVHGIPNNTPLKSGDVISVDCGAYKMDIMEIMRTL